jgi:hypothetical protein
VRWSFWSQQYYDDGEYGRWWSDNHLRRWKYWEKNLFRCHFVHLRLVWISLCWKIPFVPHIKDALIE